MKKCSACNLLRILLFSLLAVGTARFCHKQTEGFRITKIRGNLSPITCPPAKPDEELAAQPILQRKFSYLGRGLQSFVFASEDGKYVLKVFNNRRQRKIAWFGWLPGQEKTAQKLSAMFRSCTIAHELMKTETGLVYMHLNKTDHLRQKITLIDKLNIAHELDADTLAFAIQKRAALVYPTLQRWIDRGETDQAKTALSGLLKLMVNKYKKGIADNDPLIRTNYGFINTQAVQIDIGPLSMDPALCDTYKSELRRVTASLLRWLEEHSQPLAHSFREELDKV